MPFLLGNSLITVPNYRNRLKGVCEAEGDEAHCRGVLNTFWKVKVPDRYYARNETSGPTFAKIGALLLDFAILLLF